MKNGIHNGQDLPKINAEWKCFTVFCELAVRQTGKLFRTV